MRPAQGEGISNLTTLYFLSLSLSLSDLLLGSSRILKTQDVDHTDQPTGSEDRAKGMWGGVTGGSGGANKR